MKHKHHIIPKHMGGTNDPSNLIELTTKEHALAHKLLYEEHGHWQDHLAWKGLTGQIGKDELIREASRLANLGNSNTKGKSFKMSEETKQKISQTMKAKKIAISAENREKGRAAQRLAASLPRSEDHKAKQSTTMKARADKGELWNQVSKPGPVSHSTRVKLSNSLKSAYREGRR